MSAFRSKFGFSAGKIFFQQNFSDSQLKNKISTEIGFGRPDRLDFWLRASFDVSRYRAHASRALALFYAAAFRPCASPAAAHDRCKKKGNPTDSSSVRFP